MPSTKKTYNHIFVVVDSFSKFTWLYPTKSTTADEVINKLKSEALIFGNPRKIIADRGSAFTSKIFKEYCDGENIELGLITTGVPRGNGQVERVNELIIPILTKMSMPRPAEWHKYVGLVQQYINSTYNRSICRSPFELMIGRSMKLKEDLKLRDILNDEIATAYNERCADIRREASLSIQKVQKENAKGYNKKAKEATTYMMGDLVAIQRTQFGGGLKFHTKFLGPYKVVQVLRNNRYVVQRIGDHEGPRQTSSSADHMKRWACSVDIDEQATAAAGDTEEDESEVEDEM